MQYGIFYLEIHLLMNIPEVFVPFSHHSFFPSLPFKVYEMLTGRERDEVKLMAVVVALYYTQFMLRAKDTARLNVFFEWFLILSCAALHHSVLPKSLSWMISEK